MRKKEKYMGDTRPNMILFITEHWRGDCLGLAGHPAVETPHLDELSGRGTAFTQAYTPCPSCIAARRSIFTGLTPASHGMVGYQDGQPWPYEKTLARELARAGYQTINVGKTHFHPKRLHLGFEELIVPDDYNEWIRAETGLVRGRMSHGVQGNSWMARPNNLPEIQTEEVWFTNEAMKRIEKRDPARPFFMCISYNGAHPPFCPPQVYWDMFSDKEIPDPVIGEWAEHTAEQARYPMPVNAWRGKLPAYLIRRARIGYYAYLAFLDAQIGRFFEFLGRSGLGDTFCIFTADHGEMLGDHHLWRKTYPYDGSARIPFIVRPHSGLKGVSNAENSCLVGLEDIMPTFLDAAGLPVPEEVEGRSLLPLLRGENIQWRDTYHHEHSSCYSPEEAYQCITADEFKYVWNPENGSQQLFCSREDPYERCDLSEESGYADVLGNMRSLLARELKDRYEGLSDGEKLTPAHVPVWRDPGK
jgi:arylsulfatase A-like enzyme